MRLLLTASLLGAIGTLASGQNKVDLTQVPIEDLMKMQVTTASKESQSLSDVAAAVYVITQEDIRRSGAATIPDALRLAPGVEVTQIGSNRWMIGIRGFNGPFSENLLVLMDGRSVYTPLLSGVFWDQQDTPMEDIDRIEVIRGPGGSLWGANAVNGVINIITKNASKTVGSLLSSEVGTSLAQSTSYRTGVKISKDTFLRIFGKAMQQNGLDLASGSPSPDGQNSGLAGFRLDSGTGTGSRTTLLGDYRSEHLVQDAIGSAPPLSYPATEADLLGKWEQDLHGGGNQRFQAYFDHTQRVEGPDLPLIENRSTFDLDYQIEFAPVRIQTFTLGTGFRESNNATTPVSSSVELNPPGGTTDLYSFYGRDSVQVGRKTKLIAGSKFEHNSYTGWETQPSLQLLYTPSAERSYWASISRAVVIPATILEGLDAVQTVLGPPPDPPEVKIFGNPAERSQTLLAYEAGVRTTVKNQTYFDLSGFYNIYGGLVTLEPGAPFTQNGQTIYPVYPANKMSGQTAGLEAELKTKLRPWWELSGSYSLFSERLRLDADSKDMEGLYSAEEDRGGAARHMFQVNSRINMPSHLEFDSDLYYTDALISGGVPSSFRLDARLGWNPTPKWQISVGIRNALAPRQVEGVDPLTPTEAIPRSIYLKAVLRF
jgi:iron complex outermembrane receptor protein